MLNSCISRNISATVFLQIVLSVAHFQSFYSILHTVHTADDWLLFGVWEVMGGGWKWSCLIILFTDFFDFYFSEQINYFVFLNPTAWSPESKKIVYQRGCACNLPTPSNGFSCLFNIYWPFTEEINSPKFVQLFLHHDTYLWPLSLPDMIWLERLRHMKYEVFLHSISTRWAERGNE